MKKLILVTFAFSFCLVGKSLGKEKDVEIRTAIVNLEVSPNDLINIRAKNTDLIVETWNKNEVEVTATLRFDGKMTDKMISFLENFQEHVEENIDFFGGELKIDTNLDEPNKVQIGSKHVGIVIGFSEDEFKLEYKIKSPAKNEYEIENSYKDVSLIGNFEKVKFSQYSGDLEAGFIQQADLNLKYGSSSFDGLGTASLEIYEQKLDSKRIDALEINTKYSEIAIHDLGSMEADSYETDFVLGKAADIEGNFKYGEMEIKNALGKASLEFYEMDIEAVSAGNVHFRSSKYGKLRFDQINSLKFSQSYEDELTIGELGQFSSSDSKYGDHQIKTLSGSFTLNAYEDDVQIDNVLSSANPIELEGKYINASFGITNTSFHLNSHVKYGKLAYDEDKVDIRKYIKESDTLEVEAYSKISSQSPVKMYINGYEIDIEID